MLRNRNMRDEVVDTGTVTESRYRRLMQHIHDLVAETDTAGSYTYVSPSFSSVLGYNPEDLLGRSAFELVHPEDVGSAMKTFTTAIRTRSSARAQFRYRHADGQYLWLEATGNVLLNDEGEVTGGVISSRNISARILAEQESETTRALLQGIIESTNRGIFSIDTQYCYTSFNTAHAKALHKIAGAECAVGANMLNLLPERTRGAAKRAFDRALQGEQITQMISIEEGKIQGHYHASFNPIVTDGKVSGIAVIADDVTDEAVAVRQLRENEEFTRSIINSLISHVAVLDVEGTIIMVNERWRVFAAENSNTLEAPDYVGTNYLDVCRKAIEEDNDPYARQTLSGISALLDGSSRFFSCEYPCHSPEQQRWFRLNAAPLSGSRRGIVVAHLDITERKLSEDKVREQNRFLEIFLNSIPTPIFLKGKDGRYIAVNKAFEELHNIRREDVIGKTVANVVRDGSAQLHVDTDEEVFANNTPRQYDATFIDHHFKMHHLVMHKVPYGDSSGNAAGLVGILMDVTELRKIQEKQNALLKQKITLIDDIAKQRAYFEQLFEGSPDAIAILGRMGRVLDVNPAFRRVFGFDAEEIRGRDLDELIVPEGRGKASVHLTQRALAGELVRTETTRRRKDGSMVPVSIVASPITLHENTVGVYVVYRDISEQKAFEDRLRQLSLAVEQSPASIVITNTDGTIEYVNETFTRTTGYTFEEAIGKNPRILKSGQTSPSVYREMWDAITSGRDWMGEFHNKNKAGELFWETAHISPIINSNGETTHYLAVKEDITERKHTESLRLHLEQELRARNIELRRALDERNTIEAGLIQSEKMASIGLLTAGIAHEINNPLAFISSNLNRFKEYFDDTLSLLDAWRAFGATCRDNGKCTGSLSALHAQEEEIDLEFIKRDFGELMTHAHDGADRIRTIVQQLRGFSHTGDAANTGISINQALDDTVTLAWNEIKYKATVEKQYAEIPDVACNPGELKQVFLNLIVNAAHAIKPMGVITLRTAVEEHAVVVDIADTGSGIPPENLNRIFDPFFTTKPVGKGTGLGLWISASIIQKHGGTIQVESAVGRGTTFTIRLPLDQTRRDGGSV